MIQDIECGVMSDDLSSRSPSGLKAFGCEVSVLGSPEFTSSFHM